MNRQLLYLVTGVAGTLLLQVAVGALGPAGIVLALAIPLPAAFIVMRWGGKLGGAVVLGTAAIIAAGGEFVACGGYLLQYAPPSLLLPLLLRRGIGWDRAVLVTLVVLLATGGLALGGLSAYQGRSVDGMVGEYVASEVDRALAAYGGADIPQDRLQEVQLFLKKSGELMVRAYPGLATVAAGTLLLLTTLALALLAPGRYPFPGVPFHQWRAPELLIWPLIVAGFATFLVRGAPQTLGINLLTMVLPVYFLQGLAIVTYFFRKRGFSPLFRAVGYLLIAVLNPLPLIVAGLGIFDLWADFRKPRIKKT
ncbi:MAG TPA: DUF2232 domain-containing protein [Deferrimonas sp.]